MRSSQALTAVLLIAACLSSCGAPQLRVVGVSTYVPVRVLRVWVQPHPLIDPDDVLEGCRFWEPMGVECVAVSQRANADVSVLVSDESCKSLARRRIEGQKAGTIQEVVRLKSGCTVDTPSAETASESWGIKAIALSESLITLFPSCIAWADSGMLVPASIRRTSAHEFGHVQGAVHVPAICDDACIDYDLDESGHPICGEAVMNPPTPDINGITPADAAVFRQRKQWERP